jgi:hypothetical protein
MISGQINETCTRGTKLFCGQLCLNPDPDSDGNYRPFIDYSSCSYCSIVNYLKSNRVDTDQWGSGKAKTTKHLIEEINKGESVLVMNKDDQLTRCLKVVSAMVYFTDKDGIKYTLKEQKQIFKDGRIRTRINIGSVSEKMKPGEDASVAIVRGIYEELGIQGDITLFAMGETTKSACSDSFPTLLTEYITYHFEVHLTEEQFNIDGYLEEQEDKITYFVWSCE